MILETMLAIVIAIIYGVVEEIGLTIDANKHKNNYQMHLNPWTQEWVDNNMERLRREGKLK